MVTKQIFCTEKGEILVRGQINFVNISAIRTAGEKLIDNLSCECKISFADVHSINVIASSLLLCWLRYAKSKNKKIVFCDIPQKLLDWLELTNTKHLISIQ